MSVIQSSGNSKRFIFFETWLVFFKRVRFFGLVSVVAAADVVAARIYVSSFWLIMFEGERERETLKFR